ncbi:MAG TPA: phage tail sheath subtilisin-like domain-containing protein [Rhodopila sp.]|jgi:phage tail sheath gpL-like|nr:phage tail sheath subtilisin-like domain-containing protein [Rhodopila sp.]
MSGNINFKVYPSTNRVPGTFAEVDNSKANTGQVNQVALLIGPMLPSGNAVPNVPALLAGIGDAETAYGTNSVLALMAAQYRDSDSFGTVWCLPVPDSGFTLDTSTAQTAAGTTLQFNPASIMAAISVGMPVSGPDIPAGTTVSSINTTTGLVTLSQATIAAVPAGTPVMFGQASYATGQITVSGMATAAGVISLYIAGTLVSTVVSVGDTAAEIAANMLAEINYTAGLPVSAALNGAAITLTALNAGLPGNDIDMRLNYLGTAGGQALPAGVSVNFTGTASGSGYLLAGGAVNPSLTTALANLPTQPFDFIATAFTDEPSLAALNQFLNDETGRWSWTQELFGGYFGAYRGTLGALNTYGTANNDQHGSVMGIFDVPQPAWIWAAEIAAQCAVSIRANPAMPLQNITMNVLPPPAQSQFDISERNTLLYDGISTFKVTADAVVMERMVTTYQENTAGQPDDSYLDVETMYTLMAGIRDMMTYLASQYSRAILVQNGNPTPYGSGMVTAATILASVNARYATQCANGWMQNPTQFAQQSQAQNAGNGTVKLLLPFMLANQLRDIAMLVQFTKP